MTDRIEESTFARPADGSMIVGGAVVVAVVAALLAQYGGVPRAQALVGLVVILGIAYLMSTNRRAIDVTTVAWGLGLQIVFALLVLKTDTGQIVFQKAERRHHEAARRLPTSGRRSCSARSATRQAWPKIMTTVLGPEGAQYGMIFAFQVLPTIIFIAALFAILYYFGIMQFVVRAFAWAMRRVMKASGAESLNVAASIFMGQTEAPLTIRPYLPEMTQSELMTVMTSGMAHISGGIMAAYILFGIEAKHLLTAVIMTAPGTLMMAKMFVPETESPETMGTVRLEVPKTDVNVIDAAGRGHRRRAAPGAERRRDAHLVPRAVALSTRCSDLARASACSRSSAGRSRRWRGRWACRGRTRRSSATCSGRAWC